MSKDKVNKTTSFIESEDGFISNLQDRTDSFEVISYSRLSGYWKKLNV